MKLSRSQRPFTNTLGKKTKRACFVLTNTSGLLSTPVRRGGIAAGQHLWALQPVAGEAVEEGLTTGVEVRHRDLSTRGLFGERAAQHKSWNGDKRKEDREDFNQRSMTEHSSVTEEGIN